LITLYHQDEDIIKRPNSSGSNTLTKGDGSGSIHWKTITRNGLDYPQPWYHYEVWEKGDRIIKKSKYIPKKLLGDIQNLQAEKAPIREILKLLGTVR